MRSFLVASLVMLGGFSAKATILQPLSGCMDCFNFTAPSILGVGNLTSPAIGLIVLDTQSNSFKGYSAVGGWQNLTPGDPTGMNPAGTVITFAGASCPTGYLAADGSSYSQTTHATLYSAISIVNGNGSTGGSGDSGCPASSGCFNVPDYRGRFLRGVTGSSTKDPDTGSRTAMATGGNTGNNVGSVQTDQLRSHNHMESTMNGNAPWGVSGSFVAGGQAYGNNSGNALLTSSTGGNETRPVNAYVNFCIKY